jgi:mRNA interferase MazF
VKRGEIYWAALGPAAGRRPVLVLTRGTALSFLERITVAPISTVIRGVRSEVRVGKRHGLARTGMANCDSLATIPRDLLDPKPVGHLRRTELAALDQALRFALGIRY